MVVVFVHDKLEICEDRARKILLNWLRRSAQNENNLVQAIRSGASNSISQTGQQIVQRQLNIQPTLTIRPGFPVRVIVTRDLLLAPYGKGGTTP